MIVLGIDPGSTRIGYGLVRHERQRLTCLAYGTIENTNHDQVRNLLDTERQLSALLDEHRPDAVCIERLFFFKNQTTAMAVSETRGVILLTLAKHGLPIQELTPLQVKQQISAYGRAPKEQMQRRVQLLLNIKEPIRPDDAADALALAICFSPLAHASRER